jgi:hypothetical protein
MLCVGDWKRNNSSAHAAAFSLIVKASPVNSFSQVRRFAMKEVFPMIPPATNAATWIMVGATALLAALTLLFTWISFHIGKASFEVSDEGLRLRGDLYSRLIPAKSLLVDQVQIINLHHDPAHQLSRRTAGTSVSGHQAGWFRLKNGEKALVYLTDRSRVIYLPTSEGYCVMLSTPEPEALIAALRRLP